jgi:hypothetical protein
MRAVNASILALMAICGGVLLLGISLDKPSWVALAAIGGWAATVAAVVVFLATLIVIILRAQSGNAISLVRRSYLVFLNFIVALAAIWFVMFSRQGI